MDVWISKFGAGATGICIALLLAGCPARKPDPDRAIKEAYVQLWNRSYNIAGRLDITVRANESAVIGTKGGLTKRQADEELLIAEQMNTDAVQRTISLINNMTVNVSGAYDNNNKRLEAVTHVDYEQNGLNMSLQVPLYIDYRGLPIIYVSPKAASAFNMLPDNVNGKLLKITFDDLLHLNRQRKRRLNPNATLMASIKKYYIQSFMEINKSAFSDVAANAEEKRIGAARVVQMTLTSKQSVQRSSSIIARMLDELGAELDMTAEEIATAKKEEREYGKAISAILSGTAVRYSLNNQGEIIHLSYLRNMRGAKMTIDIGYSLSYTHLDKPVFMMMPEKQAHVSLADFLNSF